MSFWWKSAVRSTRAYDDPVLTITLQCRKSKFSCESCASLQFDGVTTLGAVQRRLQVVACVHRDDGSWGGRVCRRGGNSRDRQSCRTIESGGRGYVDVEVTHDGTSSAVGEGNGKVEGAGCSRRADEDTIPAHRET